MEFCGVHSMDSAIQRAILGTINSEFAYSKIDLDEPNDTPFDSIKSA